MTDDIVTLDIDRHALLLSIIIADLKDRTFLYATKKHLSMLPNSEKEDQNVKASIEVINKIISNNIIEKKEAIYYIKDAGYTDDLKSNISFNTKYNKAFKRDILVSLSNRNVITMIQPFIDESQNLLDKIKSTTGKASVDAINKLIDLTSHLNRQASSLRVNAGDSNLLIIDPISRDSNNTIGQVLETMKSSATNRIKTIRPFDDMTGGGFKNGDLSIFCAMTAGWKSNTMQNIAFYASKNNDISKFEVPADLTPCIYYVSLELSRVQLIERDLLWMGRNITQEEIVAMTAEELETVIFDGRQETGCKIPIFYSERIAEYTDTTIIDISEEISRFKSMGYYPVLCIVDYMDRMKAFDMNFSKSGRSGADGSELLKQKAKELRKLALDLQIPVITGAQMNGEAYRIKAQVEPFISKVDPGYIIPESAVSGSNTLGTEVDNFIFNYKSEVETKTETNEIVKHTYLSYILKKARQAEWVYHKSKRDLMMEPIYRSYTESLKNNFKIRDFITTYPTYHAVIPTEGVRLSETDYARSIRMFYPAERSEFVSLHDLLNDNSGDQESDVENYEELFDGML